ncbi:MAG: 23S rRNA (adenine(2503)-C(2))-methyltransferase RlmN [Synergistetes bacterium]|nr:23S rRNA (adenine(2503)-C(2))-methyltransferase RlmN [Synergistota bacterium]MCX8128261.1 23S rRNA (adenine(2503)-C(2))-methyltransferase RlmN [Synergistota bacterium]MDW8192708.1 23S rRNA (adenine(2503)-C(2))-methyltransferase RlmN [Synergistota bacterium]
MKDILNLTYVELLKILTENGEKSYRASQIFSWIYKKEVFDFESMTNLSKTLRTYLKENFLLQPLEVSEKRISKDGTTKYLLKLRDGMYIESVIIPHPNRTTYCISTQVGCPIGCKFCATGMVGFQRNLESGEIVNQILTLRKDSGINPNRIVYMGMGEPFLNYEEVIKSLKIITHPAGLNMSTRNVTISTVGIIPKIYDFVKVSGAFRLAISLHSAQQSKREKIIPIAKSYRLTDLKKALLDFQEKKGKRITIEYILLKEYNTFKEDALSLRNFLEGLKTFVNLIPYNPISNGVFKKPSEDEVKKFHEMLLKLGIKAEVRKEKGSDIEAACGQLRGIRPSLENCGVGDGI